MYPVKNKCFPLPVDFAYDDLSMDNGLNYQL